MTRSALLRAAVAPLLATALGVTALGLLAPSAAAAPLPRGLPVLAAPADDDDATNPDRPVQIATVKSLSVSQPSNGERPARAS